VTGAAPTHARQVVASLAVAALLAAAAIAIVTAKLGPGLDATELRERRELIEERQKRREELQKERRERREEQIEAAQT